MDFTHRIFQKSNKPGEIDDEGMVLFIIEIQRRQQDIITRAKFMMNLMKKINKKISC